MLGWPIPWSSKRTNLGLWLRGLIIYQGSLYNAWNWTVNRDLPIYPTKCNNIAIGLAPPLQLSLATGSPDDSIHVTNVVKELGVLMDNYVSPLSASAPRIWYASLFTKSCCTHQPSRANSKTSYNVGNWHASPPLRRETAATGPSFLAAATTSGWPDYRLQDIQRPFGCWSELVFPSSRLTWPKRAPLQGTPRCEPPPKERVGIFGEGCEILE